MTARSQVRTRFQANDIGNMTLVQVYVGALPFKDGGFDAVLSMNGFHTFSEMTRVLKKAASSSFASISEGARKLMTLW